MTDENEGAIVDGDIEAKSTTTVEFKLMPFEFKFVEENGTAPGRFEGYGAVFDNLDDGGDVVMHGAFDATLAQAQAKKRMPKMLLNHGGMAPGMTSTPTDLVPVGKWSALQPDSNGLQSKGQLINLDTETGKRIYGAMKEGELSDLSIGFTARKWQRGAKLGEPKRRLKAVDLHEISVVTFPMNDRANITSVKSLAFTAYDMRDLEAALRDGGLSRGDSVKAVAAFKSFLQRDAAGPEQEPRDAATSDDVAALVARIRAASA